MADLKLGLQEKREIQKIVEKLAEDDPREAERFLREYANMKAPLWRRYTGAVYNQPITWWIGIIQTMMVTGVFGSRHKRSAQIRQSVLYQALAAAVDVSSKPQFAGRKTDIIGYAVRHRLPEIVGRLNGSIFTNYASTGGRMGTRSGRSLLLNLSLSGTNFAIASFGALISNTDKGLKTDDIFMAILTGETGSVPKELQHLLSESTKQKIDQTNQEFDHLKSLAVIQALNNISPAPVPIAEFCSDPANAKLALDWCR